MRSYSIVYKDIHALSGDLGVSPKILYSLSNRISAHYRTIGIPKKNGGYRKLSVPDDLLKYVQRRINKILLYYMPSSEYAMAYEYGKSILSNARPHTDKQYILKLDIEDFFGTVKYTQVKDHAFPAAHFEENLRVLLARLCYNGEGLPQGAATSPKIANLILRDFDRRVGDWCKSQGITYTRYCDDMTFSSNEPLDGAYKHVKDELFKEGFLLNSSKTRFINRHHRQQVTGIVVNNTPKVPTEYTKKIRQEIYYCRKFGIDNHLEKTGYTGCKDKYLNSLLGRINYVLSVMPENEEMKDYKNQVAIWQKSL